MYSTALDQSKRYNNQLQGRIDGLVKDQALISHALHQIFPEQVESESEPAEVLIRTICESVAPVVDCAWGVL